MTRPPMLWRQRAALLAYRAVWYVLLPGVLAYFWLRGRKDAAYRGHMRERFGGGTPFAADVWVHAVSLGEMRSAVPLVRALLDQGQRVLTTHLTPAGRRAAEAAFGPEIAAGQLAVRYAPLEFLWVYRRFLRRAAPRLALVMEIEIWPVMIEAAARAGLPLYLANSQIPAKSFQRAQRHARWIGHPVRRVTGVLAKSEAQAARFRALGAPQVHVCGELRFDQPIPPQLLEAARRFDMGQGRKVVALASVVEGEDAQYLAACRSLQTRFRARGQTPPLFMHIPRAPERFAEVGDMLEAAGQRVLRRSRIFDAALNPLPPADLAGADILLGDSLGEMYFYLALADLVVVGGGFVPKGAHNVIEPLALRKPVLVGPHVWTIEYPGVEAEAAGVLRICPTIPDLAATLAELLEQPAALAAMAGKTSAFFSAHSGATARMLAVLAPHLETP